MSSSFPLRGFVVAATGSGSGKTTITMALLAWLNSRGITVAPFKVGPDFIDPGHHTKIAGRISVNLDSWMLTRAYNRYLFEKASCGMDIALAEGVMGLFDGYDGVSETGSTAQMAKWLGLPVVLILDAKGMARSAAAMVKGFETFDPDLELAGVIFSRTGSQVHYEYLKTAVEKHCTTKVLGHMPRNDGIVMPERHLGLVTADEREISAKVLDTLVSMVDENLDMDRFIAGLKPVSPVSSQNRDADPLPTRPTGSGDGPLIALARDEAFCFYYQDNIDQLKAWGARIVEFSPLRQDHLPRGIDGIYLGGGYPEVHAKTLSERKDLLAEIKRLSLSGLPIYGECGGFMFLCRQVMDGDAIYPMAGCFDFSIQMSRRLRALGYREIVLQEDTLIGKKGDVIRGHEFHYSAIRDTEPPVCAENVYQVRSRSGQALALKGYQTGQTLGSYMHVHFGSNPGCARQFVRSCQAYRNTIGN